MSSVMHPNGPEPQNTYWIRRVAVVIAALVALMLLWWVLSSLFGGGKDAGTVSATPQNNPSLAIDPSLSASPTPAASTSSSTAPMVSATPSASASTTGAASATPGAATSSSIAKASPTPTPSATPTGPVPCQPSAIRLAISGDRTPQAGKPTAFTVTATNTGQGSCFTTLDASNTSLVITSGSDRIWTTADCAKWGATGTQVIPAGKSYTWRPTWQGVRSTGSCGLSKATLGAGTYVATATMAGQSARLVMSLHA